MPIPSFARAHLKGYKGLLIFVLVTLFFLKLFYGNVIEIKPTIFFNSNSTRPHEEIKDVDQMHGPLFQKLVSKNRRFQNSTNSTSTSVNFTSTSTTTTTTKRTIVTNLNYIVTHPPISMENINSTVLSSEVGDLENVTLADFKKVTTTVSPVCPDVTSNLVGKVPIIKSPVPSVAELETRFSSWLKPGGHWQPPDCKVDKSVAIVIPFRNRGMHLLLFLQHMHPFLRRQQLDYTIFVVEQDGNGTFNRAMLMNIGYAEALKRRKFDCFIFHDIDLLPEDDRNLYTCPEQPRHMSVAVDVFKYRLPYPAIFGGVSAINTEQFKVLNGFSNAFWGWGGEDDDMSNRIRYHHLFISRYPVSIARYTMLTHKKEKASPNRYEVLKQGQKRFDKDGLNSLKYKVTMSREKLLYTWVLVALEGAPS